MASVHVFLVLIIFLPLQSWSASSNSFLSPLLSPIFGEVCNEIECGKGSCKASANSSVGYVCECEDGWKQARFDKDDNLNFMPCVIPNCTFDLSCIKGPTPSFEKEKRANESIFDPCHWADCGDGTCNKTSILTHKCECSEGYYNLLNITAFPCFRSCALGMDCSRLGLTMTNKSVSPPPSLLHNSHGTSILAVDHNWIFITSLSIFVSFWK